MARNDENRGFVCINCGTAIRPLTNGSYRNHCPVCLCSMHLDVRPGDRASDCRGLMVPIALSHGPKGWQIRHQCARCGALRVNRAATDTDQPDDVVAIAALSGGSIRQLR